MLEGALKVSLWLAGALQVAFLDVSINGLYFLNWMCNLIFFVDYYLQFVTMYQVETHQGRKWVIDLNTIILHYLRGWFMLDTISIFPFEILIFLEGGGNSVSKLKAIRMIRLVRFVRLLRIFGVQKVVQQVRASLPALRPCNCVTRYFPRHVHEYGADH